MFSADRASPPARRTTSSTISSDTAAPTSSAPRRTTTARSLRRERLQLVHLCPREQRRVHLVVRVLGRRADQRDKALLHGRQQRILLRLVEAMDLVEEQDRPLAARAQAFAGAAEHLADVLDGRRNGGELFERRPRRRRDDARERRLPGAGRPVEDRRADTVLCDREPERRSLAEHVRLADELVERSRPQPLRERRNRVCPLRSRVREEVAHGLSMLRPWPSPPCAPKSAICSAA